MTTLPALAVAPAAPLGIVIHCAPRRAPAVRFWAYIWGDDEELKPEPQQTRP